VRAADDAISHSDERTRAARPARRPPRAPSKRSSPGPQHLDPAEAPRALVKRLVSCAPLTTRGRRTHARSSQGPYARGFVSRAGARDANRHVSRASRGSPSGDRRPPTEGRMGRVPRNSSWPSRRRARALAEPHEPEFRGACPIRRTRVQKAPSKPPQHQDRPRPKSVRKAPRPRDARTPRSAQSRGVLQRAFRGSRSRSPSSRACRARP
jgi:hypothetical protein